MRDYPQFEDLGLVDDDRTEDLRPTKNAPGRCANTAEGDQNNPTTMKERVLMSKIPTTRTPAVAPAYRCTHCTAPVDTGDTCTFCAQYTPPITLTVPQRLDVLVNRIDLVRHDLNNELRGLPTDAPLMAVVDLVTALGCLRSAAVALDRATDALEAAAAEVTQ